MKKNILLIGVGGTGSNAVETFYRKKDELGNQTDNKITALVFDTDNGALKRITAAKTVKMSDSASVGTICDRIGKQYLREWFPCDAKDIRAQEMMRGASQWRKKSYLAFLNLMNKPSARSTFISALEDMVQDPGASCEVYIIASVAGGTGSGSFIPIALYAKRYLRKNLGKDPIINAMIALPDIYADAQTPENKVKVYSNAYAILRELNAINLVARNYNAGMTAKKKAPVRFRIGHPNEPNVGVLFDASDKRYWTPEAAPFSQVFLLDRIPGLNSIAAHDMVLANSLYTILCTEIGSAFDSEFSNHELVRSQNNGSNAIYAGISTSQVRFPAESVLEYLAYKKTLASCESQWLTLHKTVENTVREKEREAKAARRRFMLGDGEYAKLVLEVVEQKKEENNDDIISIVERCVDRYDEKGNRSQQNHAEVFLSQIDKYIGRRVPNVEEAQQMAADKIPDRTAKPKNSEMSDLVTDDLLPCMLEYFKKCVEAVKCAPVSTADSVITLDRKKIGTIGDQYSLKTNLLMTENGQYIHPVGAMIRLCQFRAALTRKRANHVDEWRELKQRNIEALPDRYYSSLGTVGSSRSAKSAYAALGDNRFEILKDSPSLYTKKRTDIYGDLDVLGADTATILASIRDDAVAQLSSKVYSAIAMDVDLLIAKYRSFFLRFEKEKETLDELMADAYRKDTGTVDSVINVFSTKEDKDAISELVDDGTGPETATDLGATDHIVGRGVLDAVMAAAIAERSDDSHYNDNDSSAYRSLFDSMVNAYRESISKNEIFRNIASYNAIEAVVASCRNGDDLVAMDEKLREAFSVAQDLAIPSLRLEPVTEDYDLVTPSNVMVFMMSVNTAKYIKKNAEKFGIHLPADQNSEKAVLCSCAEQFVREYSGNAGARVAIVKTIPDQILYCTGEVMDITPLCIAKFNELGDDSVYFKNYRDAIQRYKKYETDMWNPHIGNDLFKRGYLPYMNPIMEDKCDEKMVKALLYAFQNKRIRYAKPSGSTYVNQYYFVHGKDKLLNEQNQPITQKNISQLLTWMRNEDQLIEEWSNAFDFNLNEQMQKLPAILVDDEMPILEGMLTKSIFMKSLNNELYTDESAAGDDRKISVMKFVYMVKNDEEAGRDCDDAERILKVIYKIFMEMVMYRLSGESNMGRLIQVYRQQLNNFYRAFAASDIFKKRDGSLNEALFAQLVDWLNQNDLFLTISDSAPLDEYGNLAIDRPFDYRTVIKSGEPQPVENFVDDTEEDADAFPADDNEADEAADEAADSAEAEDAEEALV